MPHQNVSSPWLSADMARGLAATAPPLRKQDVTRAADELTASATPARVIDHLLPHGADIAQARRVVEVLCALREITA